MRTKDELLRAAAAVAGGDWAPPVPLEGRTLPAFPVEALPDVLEAFVTAEAEATQTPLDLPGMAVLGASSLAVQGKACVEVNFGYVEPLNTYSLVALPPGTRKSAVLGAAFRPVRDHELLLANRALPEIGRAETQKRVALAAAKKADDAAARGTAEKRSALMQDAIAANEEARQIVVPVVPRLLTDDTTPEALAKLLADHGGRMGLVSAEGGIFETMGGRYSQRVPNFDVYLKAHAGDPIRVDRIGRPPETVENPCLTIVLAVQPDVIHGLADKPGFRGRGLLARFLYAAPMNLVGYRRVGAPPVPSVVAERYGRRLKALLGMQPPPDAVAAMRLSQDAGELRSDFERWIEGQLRAGAPLAGVADWASKLTGAAVRIAGILHLAKRVESESLPWNSLINADTMGQALRIARYAIPHACEAFGMMGADPVLVAARAVLDWIKRAELIKFTKRDAFCALRGSFRRAREVDAPLDELVERGYLRPRPVPAREGPGRLGSPIFDVNPLWDRGATQNPQISRNDPDAHDALDFADSANSATEVQ